MSDVASLKKQAKAFLRDDNHQGALEVLQQIVVLEPEDLEGLYYLALAYSHFNQFQESEETIRKAIALDNQNTDYWHHLSLLQYDQSMLDDCIESTDKMLEIDPDNADAKIMLGLMAKDEKRWEEAIDYFEAGISREINEDALLNLIECYLDIENLEKAEEKLDIVEELELDDELSEKENDLFVRFYLAKAMENWSGSTVSDGETLYFPENIEQIEQSEHFIEMAETMKTENSFFQERIALLKEVINTKRDEINGIDLDEEETEEEAYETVELSEEDRLAWMKLEQVYNLWSDITKSNGQEYRLPKTIEEIKAS
ncbi:MAG: tetratricopeptide repeat protein, partial [Candidatus Cloacimonetes bacterium]|nr:tetratricopeptide repeat protein [Candidatus Cloacimonadota bacterium]